MRVILLSIAFLFLAFSAQSQVLKSAGVWYFLDVDSMTARPAVLPNGTEIAYVVGTKTVYYWNRNTSTWTAYGSTFNRDSIYFDSSIAGSGTVGDPWRVDSTLFATIAAVGDSIVAALGYVAANYFPLEGGTLTGTGGAGFIGFPSQVSAPGTPASGLNVYAQGSSFNWKGTDGYERLFASTLTGGRTYTLPDVSGTFALGTGTADRLARWTGTNTLAAGNLSDNATRLEALLPWQFHSWTTAGRPTGVNGYVGRNSTTGFQEGYFTSQWENYITSIGASNGQLAIFSSAGKIYGTNNLFWNNGETRLGIGTASPNQALEINRNTNNPVVALIENANSGGSSEAIFMAKSSAGVTQFGKRGPGYSPYKNIGPNDSYVYSNSGNFAFLVDGSGNISFSAGGSSTAQMTIRPNGNVLIGTTTDVTGYLLNVAGTGAISLTRGTVAQRPTIAASTTPLRFNTDSTSLEYGESVGTWRQLATRAYARSLATEIKRDTTIYIDDADYDFSAALTTAQISRRYNRIIFWMTTTAAAGSDSELTLHTPDVNLMQVEYLIHSVDEAGGFANVIRFGTNNAVDSTNSLVSSYFPAAGDGVHIRAGLRSGVYKYRYSN